MRALNYILPQKNRYKHRLEGLDRDWSPVGPETPPLRCLETALHMVEYSREEKRRPVNQLRSQALERGDIAQAVREVASELMSGGRPRMEVEVHGVPRRLSVAAEHHLFRIAQEALTNAVRHAQASGVRVSPAFTGDVAELTVCDDGRGRSGTGHLHPRALVGEGGPCRGPARGVSSQNAVLSGRKR